MQKAFMPFLHLSRVPDVKASAEEMSRYHEEMSEANGMVKDFLESVVRFLMPFITLFLGVVVGRKLKTED